MGRQERLKAILSTLRQSGRISINDICDSFGVSLITARRDLEILESQGLVERTRGGAIIKSITGDSPFFKNLDLRKEQKERIAKKAIELLNNGQVVAAGGGTTVYYAMKALESSSIHALTIVTNSITTAWAVINLSKPFSLIHSGGTVRQGSFECVGEYSSMLFERMYFDCYILGASGVSSAYGVTVADFEERNLAELIIKRSKTVILLADSTKIEQSAPYKICDLGKIDILVTDTHATPSQIEVLRSFGISVISV
ncbi:DeoR/GlpR family DNA-binding transcription regulator [Pseudothermotoga sp. U03pept]|uniref:DeoR/GlpR family DNA-binding transcription regulator n=1 Tax=Pseudothermotoga sp. U03pept TaxID=3447012 RepID=UPI003EFBF431